MSQDLSLTFAASRIEAGIISAKEVGDFAHFSAVPATDRFGRNKQQRGRPAFRLDVTLAMGRIAVLAATSTYLRTRRRRSTGSDRLA
jgi:hypothetical protein